MSDRKQTGGGRFDPNVRGIYFCAAHGDDMMMSINCNPYGLFAVNDVTNIQEGYLVEAANRGGKLFMDSGVYHLAMTHAKSHNMTHNEALGVRPDKLDNWDSHLAFYIELCRRWEDDLWGYVELDLGGKDMKRQTRAMLEAEGLRPIPVFHPLLDGLAYFDELADQYDRICVGNLVQANPSTRVRILATVYQRKRIVNPDLFIHALGLTPSAALMTYPMDSCDSSSWLSGARWGGHNVIATGQSLGHLPLGYFYTLKDKEQWNHIKMLAAYDSEFWAMTWRQHQMQVEELIG